MLAIDWNIKWLRDIYEDDKKTWSNSYNHLHNLTMTKILPQIENKIAEILESIKKILTVNQKDYWETKEYILYRKAKDLDVSNLNSLIY